MALLPAGRLKSLSLWDFQPKPYSALKMHKKFTPKEMQDKIKAAADGTQSNLKCDLGDHTTPFLLIKYMLECYDNMLQMMVMVWGEGYQHDPYTAGKVIREEIYATHNEEVYSQPFMVWRLIEATMQNFDKRLEKQCQSPHISTLHAYEKKSGNCIRPVPCLGCEEVLRAIPIKLEQLTRLHTMSHISADDQKIPGVGKIRQPGSSKGTDIVLPETTKLPAKLTNKEKRLAKGAAQLAEQLAQYGPDYRLPTPKASAGSKRTIYNGGTESSGSKPNGQVKLAVGQFFGEGGTDKYSSLLYSAPYSPSKGEEKGTQYCPRFQLALSGDKGGCGNEYCELCHEVLPSKYWPIPWQSLFLVQGGHRDWGGKLDRLKLESILTAGQLFSLGNMSEVLPRRAPPPS
jgi:hypothetical protein